VREFVRTTTAPAVAQDFPTRAVEYITPFNPGGEPDVTARLREPMRKDVLGVNVRHQPGGGGAVAWSEGQGNAVPDGHAIIGIDLPHIAGRPIRRSDAGCTTEGFEIIPWVLFTRHVRVVPASSPVQTIEDMVSFAKDNPPAVTRGGSGTFSGDHLVTLRFEELAETDVSHTPVTGTGPLPAAIHGRQVGFLVNNSTLAVLLGAEVRVLAIASDERFEVLPDAPTVKEQGHDIVGGTCRGVAAPEGAPADPRDDAG
jgi:tripartite-type tricarboxylate transporter receptor subunit TctC